MAKSKSDRFAKALVAFVFVLTVSSASASLTVYDDQPRPYIEDDSESPTVYIEDEELTAPVISTDTYMDVIDGRVVYRRNSDGKIVSEVVNGKIVEVLDNEAPAKSVAKSASETAESPKTSSPARQTLKELAPELGKSEKLPQKIIVQPAQVILVDDDKIGISDAKPYIEEERDRNVVDIYEDTSEKTIVTRTFSDGTTETVTLSDDQYVTDDGQIKTKVVEDKSDKPRVGYGYSHFSWGAETGICADLSGMDMSTFNFDVLMGYRNKFITLVGVGAGCHKSLGNRDTFLPVYFVFRSSFRPKPSLCFLHLRIGYSFNTVAQSPMFGDICSALGCGFNLSRGRRMQSYLLVAYTFRHFNQRHAELISSNRNDVSLAQIAFGITF